MGDAGHLVPALDFLDTQDIDPIFLTREHKGQVLLLDAGRGVVRVCSFFDAHIVTPEVRNQAARTVRMLRRRSSAARIKSRTSIIRATAPSPKMVAPAMPSTGLKLDSRLLMTTCCCASRSSTNKH